MGAVFHAVDEQTHEPVAIKRLQANAVFSTPEAVERFRREGEALRLLDHPNIVKVLDVFQDAEGHYLVMELVAGGSLAGLLTAAGPLAIERVLALSIDLSDALARAH